MKLRIMDAINSCLNSVISERTGSMGIAMIMVLLYHFNAKVFYPGFLGVDVFLFLSAYGLCKSFEKNSIKVFYRHRFDRIVPMYIIMGTGISLISFFFGGAKLTVWDWLCNMTSLNYYGFGGFVFEWYLSFLLLVYLLFPLYYKVCKCVQETPKAGWVLFIVMVISLLVMTNDLKWYYDTAIGRIPIILLGILCYPFSEKTHYDRFAIIFGLGLIISVFLYSLKMCHTYVIAYMLAPLFILFVGFVLRAFAKVEKVKILIELIGKYTLEIYVANVFVCLYRKTPMSIFESKGSAVSFLIYLVLNVLVAILLININRFVKRRLISLI